MTHRRKSGAEARFKYSAVLVTLILSSLILLFFADLILKLFVQTCRYPSDNQHFPKSNDCITIIIHMSFTTNNSRSLTPLGKTNSNSKCNF